MGFDLGTAIGGFGLNLANNAVQYYTQKNQQRQAQSNEQKNMRLQSELEQQGYYNNIVRIPQALREAGINPAVAAGMSAPSPSVSHSGNSQSVGLQTNGMDIVNGAILNPSQVRLNEAAADKAAAEADKIRTETGKTPYEIALLKAQTQEREIYNKRLVDADKAAVELIKKSCLEMAQKADSQRERDFYNSMAQRADNMSVGSLDAWIRATDWLSDLSEYDKNAVLNQVQKKIGTLRLHNNEDLESLAHMPSAQFKEVFAHIADLNSSRQLRDVQRKEVVPLQKQLMTEQSGNIAADTELKGSQKSELDARAAAIPKEVEQAKHKNFVQMIDEGEYGNAAWYIAGELVNALVGFLIVSRLKGASAPASRPRTTTKSNVDYNYPSDMPKDIQKTLDDYYKGEYGD